MPGRTAHSVFNTNDSSYRCTARSGLASPFTLDSAVWPGPCADSRRTLPSSSTRCPETMATFAGVEGRPRGLHFYILNSPRTGFVLGHQAHAGAAGELGDWRARRPIRSTRIGGGTGLSGGLLAGRCTSRWQQGLFASVERGGCSRTRGGSCWGFRGGWLSFGWR